VLVHGLAQCHLCFEPQIRPLAEYFRLVAFDCRGHGASEQPADPAAYQGGRVWADDLATVMSAKVLKRPVLVGWSMGGRVIRQYLINYGDAALGGINFVASQVIEEPRFRGPGAPKALPEQMTLAAEIDNAIDFLDGCFGKKPGRSGLPPRARLQRARARKRSSGDRRLVDAGAAHDRRAAARHRAGPDNTWTTGHRRAARRGRDRRVDDRPRAALLVRRLRSFAVRRGRGALQRRAGGVRDV
jgi:pimeloyl-ACP methyl ester carboxylesterase